MSPIPDQAPHLPPRSFGAVMFGLAAGSFLFLLLPLSQMLSLGAPRLVPEIEATLVKPPILAPVQEPPVIEDQPEEIEALQDEPKPPTLTELEFFMNPDVRHLGKGGDFTMPVDALADQIEDTIFRLKDLTVEPRALAQARPMYPPELQRNRIEGDVRVEFVISRDGATEGLRVLSADHPDFVEPTLRAIRRWKYEAGERGGEKVAVRVRLTVPYRLD